MAGPTYEKLQAKSKLPVKGVARVRDRRNDLIVATDAFGQNTYNSNIAAMGLQYVRADTLEPVTFRPATTAESILIAAANIEEIKQKILNPGWLQAGRIARASEGVYINIPLGADGNPIEDENLLKSYFTKAERKGDIWIAKNKVKGGVRVRNVSFVPYDTFKTGEDQEIGEFVEGGLARGLELTRAKKASNLAIITSKENYPRGVNVCGFDPAEKGYVLQRVVGLISDDDGRLYVSGSYWVDLNYGGFAFGVVK